MIPVMVAGLGDGLTPGSSPSPTWTVLIPTLGQRRELFERLLDVLLPQLERHAGAVRVLAWWNNGHPPLPTIRQALLEAADTEYVSFVDDDDLVPPYFVDETRAALASRPDYVGWQSEFQLIGRPARRRRPAQVVYHSLHHGGWYTDRTGMYRDITHINPMRTELARRGDFRVVEPGEAEDRAWVDQVRPHLRTEVVVDKVMYHYLYDPAASAWRKPQRIQRGPFEPARPVSPYFAYHPDCEAR